MQTRSSAAFPKHLTRWLVGAGVCFLLLACGTLAAQQTNRNTVRINLTGSDAKPKLQVVPRRARICANPKTDCAGQVQWKASGRPLAANETLVVRAKADQPDCFSGPFTLTEESPMVDSGPPQCGPGNRWKYDVDLVRDGAVVFTLDPSVVIDP